jgi:hypothetical protein
MAAGWISMWTGMQHIEQANQAADSKFRKSASSLNDLISLLGGSYSGSGADERGISAAESLRIEEEIRKIKTTKLLKYQRLLRYIGTQLDIDSFAIPVKPTMHFESFKIAGASVYSNDKWKTTLHPGAYVHMHRVDYQSSNGENAAFSHIMTREHVWYPYEQPTDVPYSNVMRKTASNFYQPGEAGSTGQSAWDNHSTVIPEYVIRWPKVRGRIRIRQKYEYKLPERDDWKEIPGAAYTMEKGVRVGKNGVDAFYFSKKNWTDYNTTPFHFEVEYDLGQKPPLLTTYPALTFRALGMPNKKDIRIYATVIADGSGD